MNVPQPLSEKKTIQAYLLSSALNAPFWALYGMLIFILYKDLHASSLQITLLIALKPVVSLFSIYWSQLVHERPDRLRLNVIIASILSHLPYFFFPWVENPWFIVGSGILYMFLTRGVIPAWMQILKMNLPEYKREKVFSYGSAISYLVGIGLPFLLGKCLDTDPTSWKLLFPAAALFSFGALYSQWRIPISFKKKEDSPPVSFTLEWKKALLAPWKNAWHLLKTRPDFFRFQVGFMLGGSGLMIMQPALPPFFVDHLKISHTELFLALSFFKGAGFALASRFWAQWIGRTSIYRFSSLITFLAALFPLGLLCGSVHISLVYFAYLIDGVMQAGSKLSWHLSGPIFAKEEDSSMYSSVNVVTVGLRGLFAPFLGAFLCQWISASWVLLIGSFFCLIASLQLGLSYLKEKRFPKAPSLYPE